MITPSLKELQETLGIEPLGYSSEVEPLADGNGTAGGWINRCG